MAHSTGSHPTASIHKAQSPGKKGLAIPPREYRNRSHKARVRRATARTAPTVSIGEAGETKSSREGKTRRRPRHRPGIGEGGPNGKHPKVTETNKARASHERVGSQKQSTPHRKAATHHVKSQHAPTDRQNKEDEEQPEDAEEVVFGGPTGRTGTYGSTEDQKHLKCERGGEEWTLQPRR